MRKLLFILFEALLVITLVAVAFGVQVPGLSAWILLPVAAGFSAVVLLSQLGPGGRIAAWCFALCCLIAFVAGMGFWRYTRLHRADIAAHDWMNAPLVAGARPFVIHISDTHFIGNASGFTNEKRPWNETIVAKAVQEILRLSPQLLIISGDVTDTGLDTQWRQAARVIFQPLADTGIRVVVAPGNHDLQPSFSRSFPGTQIHQVLLATDRVSGELLSAGRGSVHELLVQPITQTERATMRVTQYTACTSLCLEQQPPSRSCLPSCGSITAALTTEELNAMVTGSRFREACRAWYPLASSTSDRRAIVIALCSVADENDGIVANAIGAMGNAQLSALSKALPAYAAGAQHVFVVMHHPPISRPDDHYGWPARGTSFYDSTLFHYAFLGNAVSESRRVMNDLLALASARPTLNVHLAYGHRHQLFVGSVSDPTREDGRSVTITEAPALYEPDGGMLLGYEEPNGRIDWRWRRNQP